MNIIRKAAAKVSPHAKQQAWRFARLTALSAFGIWLAHGKQLDATAAWGALVGGGEVALRAWRTTALASLTGPDTSVSVMDAPEVVPAPEVVAPAPVEVAPVQVTPAAEPVSEPTAAPTLPA